MSKKKKKGSGFVTFLLVLLLIAGIGLLAYPTFADWWNKFHASRAISSYTEQIATLDTTEIDKMWEEAITYNQQFERQGTMFELNDEEMEIYNRTLNIADGVMAYIEIPKISVSLPIYHGTNEAVLQIAIGHIESTSLPVGGKTTHCVLSGHRGLPSAKLFSDLDQLVEGDTFIIQTLGRTLTYEVDQIRVVLPEEIYALRIEDGKDYCTLVTCTPYGINTHRLLVRGHRVSNMIDEEEKVIYVPADAMQIQPIFIAPFIAGPLLLILFIMMLVNGHKRRNRFIKE